MHISEFQEMMNRLYGNRDRARGVDGTYKWLIEEVARARTGIKGTDRVALEKEFADVIAWLSSLANIIGR
jgi:NTP pyrophosphatase (non-canonical NTP hydrolase)